MSIFPWPLAPNFVGSQGILSVDPFVSHYWALQLLLVVWIICSPHSRLLSRLEEMLTAISEPSFQPFFVVVSFHRPCPEDIPE